MHLSAAIYYSSLDLLFAKRPTRYAARFWVKSEGGHMCKTFESANKQHVNVFPWQSCLKRISASLYTVSCAACM